MAVEVAIKKVLDRLGIDHLKDHQKSIFDCVMAKKDCVAILPTGYGKSLPYQLYLPVQRELNAYCREKVIVCCPLISLMQAQTLGVSREKEAPPPTFIPH